MSNGQIGGTSWDGRDPRVVNLIEIAHHVELNTGDTVVTSGLTSVFPEGILVGVVAETELEDGKNYHQTLLKLATDYKSLKYVQVLRNNNALNSANLGVNHEVE
jgi:rod shape-determining protein MreC